MPDEPRREGAVWVCASAPGIAGKLPSERPEGRPSAHGWPRETIMTPDTRARAGHRRPQVDRADSGTAIRSGGLTAEAARTGPRGAAAFPPHASPPSPFLQQYAPRVTERVARRARGDAGIVKLIPYLAVLVVTVAGIYIAWLKGSAGGGEGGVIAGAALLATAVVRLLLPGRLAGLLATRKRAIDVATLTVFGVCLLLAGLVVS